MLGVEAVAERMGDHVVGHHPTVPGVGKTAQAVDASFSRLDANLKDVAEPLGKKPWGLRQFTVKGNLFYFHHD